MDNTRVQPPESNAKYEENFLKGVKDPNIGVYCDLFSAKTDYQGQDGGVVTALLVRGFEEGLFDSAIVVRRINGYNAEATVVTSTNDVIGSKGTQYLHVNVAKKLRELIQQGKDKIAVVCTPCEARVARKIQQTIKKGSQITILGLFCNRAFNPKKLRKEISDRLSINIDSAEKTQVSQGKFRVSLDGKEHSCRVKDLENASETMCNFCDDFTSSFADVSIGSAGSKEGYSTVIVRSAAGEKLIEKSGISKEPVDKDEVSRTARVKKKRSQKRITNLKSQSLPSFPHADMP